MGLLNTRVSNNKLTLIGQFDRCLLCAADRKIQVEPNILGAQLHMLKTRQSLWAQLDRRSTIPFSKKNWLSESMRYSCSMPILTQGMDMMSYTLYDNIIFLENIQLLPWIWRLNKLSKSRNKNSNQTSFVLQQKHWNRFLPSSAYVKKDTACVDICLLWFKIFKNLFLADISFKIIPFWETASLSLKRLAAHLTQGSLGWPEIWGTEF